MNILDREVVDFIKSRKGRAFGRVVRSHEAPVKLAAEQDRKIAMVMGPSGLASLNGTTEDFLISIGYTHDYIRRQILEGMHFYLIMFGFGDGCDRALRPRLATWENVLKECALAYPMVAGAFEAAGTKETLMAMSFARAEELCGFSLSEVDKNGVDDPRFVSFDRLAGSDMSPLMVRRFLYHCCRISDLFSGDGWTRTAAGKLGLKEYVMPNMRIDQLAGHELLPLK